MGEQHDVLHRQKVWCHRGLALEHVEPRSCNGSLLERRDQRRFGDDVAPGVVDQERPALHQGEPPRIDQVTRLRCGGRVERYEVRLAQHVVDAAPGLRAQLGDDRRRWRVGIVEDHPHPETVVGALRDGPADTAQPDEAERLAAHARAQQVGRPPPRPGAGAWTGWGPTHLLGTRVSGKTLGLIGLGRIGRAVAQRAHHGFGMRVIFHDPYPPPPAVVAELGAEPRGSVDDVLREADFVSLHSPATPETRHLIDARRLALMKRGAFLINNARGDIVDELALVAALKQGTIAGAGLDVFEREPAVTPDLLTMENVVLLPHLGSATHETRIAMGLRALENLKAFFAGAPPRDRVA